MRARPVLIHTEVEQSRMRELADHQADVVASAIKQEQRHMIISALQQLPFVSLSEDDVRRTQQGMALKLPSGLNGVTATADNIRMRDEAGKLIAVGSYDPENLLIHPRVVLSVEQRR